MAVVTLIPIWFGGVSQASQVALALVICLSLLINLQQIRCVPESMIGRVGLLGIGAVLLVSLLPISRTLTEVPAVAAVAQESLAFSFAPGETLLRAWQLAIAAACFVLARAAVSVRGFFKLFTLALAVAVLLMAAAEIWRQIDGRGIWQQTRHYPAGTFANRNHFASWMVLAAMFLMGALMRKLRMIREGNPGKLAHCELALYGSAVLLSIGTLIASGSRGGVLALGAGVTTWAAVLWRRKAKGASVAVFAILLACAAGLFALSGEGVMSRLTEGGLDFKVRIWEEAFELFRKFPFLGIGLGAFADVFSVFKSFHGEGSILFVENEYLQWLLELGALGTVAAFLIVFAVAGLFLRAMRQSHLAKSELFFGAIAGLIAVAIHAAFEFVFHVPSVMVLTAVFLGIAVGLAQESTRKVEPLPLRKDFFLTALLMVGIGAVAAQQARAIHRWNSSDTRGKGEAVEMWPLQPMRAIAAVREAVTKNETTGTPLLYAQQRALLTAAIAWRPYHWELRLERTWLDMAFGGNLEKAILEAQGAIALNPLQPKIPLRFASVLASQHPARALEFARAAPVSKYEDVREALRIGWLISNDASLLWELTPATGDGLRALAQFAREQKLGGVATEAERRIIGIDGNHH